MKTNSSISLILFTFFILATFFAQVVRGQSAPPQVSSQITTSRSRNWAGYVAASGGYSSVTGTWTVPQNSTDSRGADATWVGIGGVASNDLIQAGTQATVDRGGSVTYQTWYEMLPGFSRPLDITVNAGDSVTATISQQADNNWLISVKNNTNGQSTQVTRKYLSSLSSAEWIEEAPSGGRMVLPLDNFGSVTFNNASVVKNGQTLTPAQANAQAVNMVNTNRQTLASASDLGSDGASFTIKRQDNVSTSPQPEGIIYFRIGSGRRGVGQGPTRRWVIPNTQAQTNANGKRVAFWQSLSAFLNEINLPGASIATQIENALGVNNQSNGAV